MKLIAYVHFAGECEEALNFYKETLGGTILQLSRMGDSPMDVAETLKKKIMHARLQLGESVLYMSDTFDNNSIKQGNNVSLSLDLDEPAELDSLFAKLAVGGAIKMPVQDTFWGARFGMLVDKFGIDWMMNCELKKA